MLLLIAIGVLAGLIAGVSPCVLPVLPVVFFAGGSGRPAADDARSLRRPVLVVAGLVLGFSAFTLLGSSLLRALHLPDDFLRWAGLAILVLVGLGLVFPPLEQVLQRPFRPLARWLGAVAARTAHAGAFVLGLGVGALYVPCAGPVLAAISVAGSSAKVSGSTAALTVAFAVGVAIPLLAFAMAGAGIARRLAAYRSRNRMFRIVGGLVMVLLAFALTFNLTDGLQRTVPAYTQALQDRVENNAPARAALAGLNPRPAPLPVDGTASGPVVRCTSHAKQLANCGAAPQIVGISSWINTPGDSAINLTALKGKVVLVNFWTFSCVNCQRALPFIKAWDAAYRSSGLDVIGIHTPEFSYEHDLQNVRQAVQDDHVDYPVGLDNSSATWRNFGNSYWPAEYLIDAHGVLRHVVYGEGGYADSEALIRELLRAANPSVILPSPVDPTVPVGG